MKESSDLPAQLAKHAQRRRIPVDALQAAAEVMYGKPLDGFDDIGLLAQALAAARRREEETAGANKIPVDMDDLAAVCAYANGDAAVLDRDALDRLYATVAHARRNRFDPATTPVATDSHGDQP